MKHAPITKQRSQWLPVHTSGTDGIYQRRVNDGELVAIAADEPGIGWHLSISFRDHRGKLSRYPRWDEIMHARDHLLPSDVGFVMHLPADGEYVALHPTTFHLHQHPRPEVPA